MFDSVVRKTASIRSCNSSSCSHNEKLLLSGGRLTLYHMLTQWLTGYSGSLMYTHIDTSALSYVLRFHQCWVLVWMQKRCSISKDTSKLQVWHCSELHIFHKQDQKLFCYTEGWHWLFFIAELRQNEKCCLKMYCRIHLVKDKCGFKQKLKDFGGLCTHRSRWLTSIPSLISKGIVIAVCYGICLKSAFAVFG